MKTNKTVYGIEMTSWQEILFAKYRKDNQIAMNTLTKEERTELTENWLKNNMKINLQD